MLKTGVDLIKVSRIEKILENKKEAFYKKVFTATEISYINDKNHRAKTVAGLFAAKEAVSKALGTGIGQVGWRDIEIVHSPKGKPLVVLSQKAWIILKDIEINEFDLSISHEEEYAIAFVVAYFNANKQS